VWAVAVEEIDALELLGPFRHPLHITDDGPHLRRRRRDRPRPFCSLTGHGRDVRHTVGPVSADPTDAEIEAILLAGPEERWAELWAAVTALENDDSPYAEAAGGQQTGTIVTDGVERPVYQMPYYEHSAAVDRLHTALGGVGAIVPFPWPEWTGWVTYKGGRGLDDAPVADAVRMATAIIRANRFSDGTIVEALENGTMQAVLRRLRAWYETERAGR
jgi:hypothetical protein